MHGSVCDTDLEVWSSVQFARSFSVRVSCPSVAPDKSSPTVALFSASPSMFQVIASYL